jgi:hypothetical protein
MDFEPFPPDPLPSGSPMSMAFAVKDGLPSMRFETHDSASMLFRDVDIDLAAYPMLAWRWYIELLIRSPLDERTRKGDDHAAATSEGRIAPTATEARPSVPLASGQTRPDADTANTLPQGRTTLVQFACPNSDGPAEGSVNRCPTRITVVRSAARRRSIPNAAWPCLAVRSLKPPSAAGLAFRDPDFDGGESSSTSVAERSPSLSSLDNLIRMVDPVRTAFFSVIQIDG